MEFFLSSFLFTCSVSRGGGKRQGHEDDHLTPSSAEVKNGAALPPLPDMSSRHGT
jgi:hypothetical protein